MCNSTSVIPVNNLHVTSSLLLLLLLNVAQSQTMILLVCVQRLAYLDKSADFNMSHLKDTAARAEAGLVGQHHNHHVVPTSKLFEPPSVAR